MARLSLLSAALSIFVSTADAIYTGVHFTSNQTDFLCPGFVRGLQCRPPQVCARDPATGKYYCCDPEGGVCFAGAPQCDGGGQGQPSTSQIGCSSGENAYCCLAERESCTQAPNQINICWGTQENPMSNLTPERVNETYSSLSSAQPSQTIWPVELSMFDATSTPASTSASSTPTTPPSSKSESASPSSTSASVTGVQQNSQPASASSSISGGAIAGIVIGVVAAICLLGAAAFFIWRKKHGRTPPAKELDATPYSPYHDAGQGGLVNPYAVQPATADGKFAHHAEAEYSPAPVEMFAGELEPTELPSGTEKVNTDNKPANKT